MTRNRRSYYYGILLAVVLVLAMVVPVSAYSFTSNSSYNGNIGYSGNDTYVNARNHVGNSLTTPATNIITYAYAKTTSEYWERVKTGGATWDTSALPDEAIISSAYILGYSTAGYGHTSLIIWSDFTPPNPLTYGVTDYSQTTWALCSDNVSSTIMGVANSSKTWNLTAVGLSKINKTGYTTFMLTDDYHIDNKSMGWESNYQNIYGIWSSTYAGGMYTPQLIITYTLPQITTYPVNTLNETLLLPNSDTNLPPLGGNISGNVTIGQSEPMSFIVKSDEILHGVNVTVSNLTSGSDIIANTSIDVMILKSWYQAWDSLTEDEPGYDDYPKYKLTPELLLHNENTINCNYTTEKCAVYLKNGTYEGYYSVGNDTAGAFPQDATIYDNKSSWGTINPLNFTADENKHIFIVVNTTPEQPPGNYTGTVTLSSPSSTDVVMNISMRVLPLTLSTPTKEQSIYYPGGISSTDAYTNNVTGATYKSWAQYSADLAYMKYVGIQYPRMSQYGGYKDSITAREKALYLRNISGLPQDKIYLDNSLIPKNWWYNDTPPYDSIDLTITTDPVFLTELGLQTVHMKNMTGAWGFGDMYGYSYDEPTAPQISVMSSALATVHSNGGKTYFATNKYGTATSLASDTDLVNVATDYNATDADAWRAGNPSIKIFNYANPQLGNENPEIYRQNYGFGLWVSGYDGAMDFAYQQQFGQSIWNDYDTTGDPVYGTYYYRDFGIAYPKTDGVIGTIQAEGYKAGVTDSQIADYLTYTTGNTTEATDIINAGIAAGVDMSDIRNHLIDHILAYDGAVIPTASFTKNNTTGLQPAAIQFNDTSTNTPTMWNYSWGDGQWSNGTANATHRYSRPSLFSVSLTVSNAAGNSTTSQRIWATSGW
jgi:PKD repeat protein